MVKSLIAVMCALVMTITAIPMYGTYAGCVELEAEVECVSAVELEAEDEYDAVVEAEAEYDSGDESLLETQADPVSIDVQSILGQDKYFEYFGNWSHLFGQRIGGRYGGRIEHAYYFENGVSVSVQAVDTSDLGLDIVSVDVGCVTGIFLNFGLVDDRSAFNFNGIDGTSTYADVAAIFEALPYCTVRSAFDERIGAAKSYGFWAFEDSECTRFVRFFFDDDGYVLAISFFVK